MSKHVRVEWRVTGQPNEYKGVKFPPYEFVWRDDVMYDERSRREGDPNVTAEGAARHFIESCGREWEKGPFLTKRTVTTTDWEKVE